MGRNRIRRLGALLTAGLIALWLAAPALAAAPPQPTSADPGENAELHEAPETVSIEFDQPLDPSSELKVVDECNRRLDAGTTDVSLTTMSVELAKKPAGEYSVHYSAVGVGGVTGTSTGEYKFSVHFGKACDGAPAHHHGGNGGHGGHGGHSGKGHGGHGGHGGNHQSGHGQHSDHSASHGGTHTAAGHSAHAEHLASGHSEHDGAHHHDDAGAGNNNSGEFNNAAGNPPIGRGASAVAADGAALVTAFALAAALGILGGYLLRNSRLA